MLTAKEKSELSALLEQFKTFLSEYSGSGIHDFYTFKTQVLIYELQEEVDYLETLLNREDARALFIERCRWRSIQNKDTCLNITSFQGGSNQLFWVASAILFQPKTLSEQLSILLPEAKILVCPEVVICDESKKISRSNIRLILNQQPMESLVTEPDFDDLAYYITAGEYFFDVREIANFDFKLHQSLYERLQRDYPCLLGPLYDHNPAFRRLHDHILMLSGDNFTPLKKIQSLIFELRLGGENVTGEVFASIDAQIAFTDFQGYMASLPLDLKQTLLSLVTTTGFDGVSLEIILASLSNESCVETAADQLQLITENPSNQLILNTHPKLSTHHLQQIKQLYGRQNSLLARVDEGNIKFPRALLGRVLSGITIVSDEELICLLLWLPPSLYKNFLQSASFTSHESIFSDQLAQAIKSYLLSEEDRKVFYEQLTGDAKVKYPLSFAVLSNSIFLIKAFFQGFSEEQFKGFMATVDFAKAIHSGAEDADIITCILERMPEKLRCLAIKVEDEQGFSVLQRVARAPDCLLDILSLLPENERLLAITMEVSHGTTVFQTIRLNLNLISEVLLLLNQRDCYSALMIKDYLGQTVLHGGVNHIPFLRLVFSILPVKWYLDVLSVQDNAEKTLLHYAEKYPKSLDFILKLLSSEDRLNLIRIKEAQGRTVLHLAARKPLSIEILLRNLPEEDRLSVVNLDDLVGKTVLHYACHQEDTLRVVLQLLPEPARMDAISAMDHNEDPVIHSVGSRWALLKIIFQLLPENQRLTAVGIKDAVGFRFLNRVVYDISCLKIILQLLPEADRFVAVTTLNARGRSIIQQVMYDAPSLKLMLELLSEEARFQVVTDITGGKSILHSVASHLELLKIILQLLPEESLCKAINSKDNCGDSVLHLAQLNRESLKLILQLMPEEDRLAVVSERDSEGDTLFQLFDLEPGYLFYILKFLPEPDRSVALNLKDSEGRTVFDYFLDAPVWLNRVLQLLPKEYAPDVSAPPDVVGGRSFFSKSL